METYYNSEIGGGSIYLGKIVDNFDVCSYSFRVLDRDDNVSWYIEASSCQLGLLCRCPFQGCEEVEFKLWRRDREEECESIKKYGKESYAKNAIGDADDFSVPFPPGCNFDDKVLLMTSAIFIDYLMFENKSN